MLDDVDISRKNILEAFIREYQPKLGSYSLKRAICRNFNVKNFGEITEGKALDALVWVQKEVHRLLQVWRVAYLSEFTTQKILEEQGIKDDGTLRWRLIQKVNSLIDGDMTEEKALSVVRNYTKNKNLYELAYGEAREAKQ